MLFTKEYIFVTVYTKEEITRELRQILRFSDKRTWRFVGSITKESFIISPLFNSVDYYRIRPEFYGLITMDGNENSSKVFLKSGLSFPFKMLLYMTLIFNLIVLVLLWYYQSSVFDFYKIAIPIGVPFMYIVTILAFHLKRKRAISILTQKLRLKRIS